MGSHHLNRIEVLYISFKGGSPGETVFFFMKSFGFPMWKGSSVASSSNLRHIWVSPSPLFTSAYFVQNIVWYPWWHLITIETVDEPCEATVRRKLFSLTDSHGCDLLVAWDGEQNCWQAWWTIPRTKLFSLTIQYMYMLFVNVHCQNAYKCFEFCYWR